MKETQSSYNQIVKSTGIYGASQLVNIVLGIVRSKLTAIFLGTTGIGIIGLLQSVIDISRSATGLGLDTGATKNIATTDFLNQSEVGKTLYTVNIWYAITAALGSIFCLVFAEALSNWAFETDEYTLHIAVLSIAVFLIAITACITSSLQGLRKIPYMALVSSISSFLNLLVMIPIYYYWKIDGIVPVYILTSLITCTVGFYFYRRIGFKPIRIPTKEVICRGKNMLVLGIFLVIAGILSTVSLFLVRAYLNREVGLETVGLFQAAWIITALMWGIVIRSTNSDFFPKLCAIVEKKEETKRYVNEQTYIVLLIISPITIGLVTFADYVLQLLYTTDFIEAADTLRWHLLGAFFKMAVTPIATIILAKNKGVLHLICETLFWGVYLLSCYLLFPIFNLEATGMAYLIAYLVYIPIVLVASFKITKTTWTLPIVLMISVNIIFIVFIYFAFHYYTAYKLYLGTAILFITLLYSLWKLRAVLNLGAVLKWFKKRM